MKKKECAKNLTFDTPSCVISGVITMVNRPSAYGSGLS